jgi:hypothetical protein
MSAETTAPKQRGRPFPRGVSGNPRGRPAGPRNAATTIAEQLLDGEADALTRKAIERAKQGDVVALRLCLDRILPPRRERPVRFRLHTQFARAFPARASTSREAPVGRVERCSASLPITSGQPLLPCQ